MYLVQGNRDDLSVFSLCYWELHTEDEREWMVTRTSAPSWRRVASLPEVERKSRNPLPVFLVSLWASCSGHKRHKRHKRRRLRGNGRRGIQPQANLPRARGRWGQCWAQPRLPPPGAAAGRLLWRVWQKLEAWSPRDRKGLRRVGAGWVRESLEAHVAANPAAPIHLPPSLPAFSAELRPGVSEGGAVTWGSEKAEEGAFYLASVTPPGPSQLDKTLQRKCLALISPVTPVKVCCCLFIFAVLTTSVIALSIVLSGIRNWTLSQTFCVSLEASLAQFATMEELNFLKRYKGPSDHWIGLRRESSHHIWEWTDNMEYNNTLAIRGGGECAFLNDNGVNSDRIYINRKWICSKPNSYVYSCQLCPH
nr:uncharacterized protein LOC100171566 [Pongo abelii]